MIDNTARVRSISIDCRESLLSAIKQMDKESCKLLLVKKNGEFFSLISIGDIQRAILNEVDLGDSIENNIRPKIHVCSSSDSEIEIRESMKKFRSEFMPILNSGGKLTQVVFWDEVFEQSFNRHSNTEFDLPVVIMAGGKGTRLQPITNIIPKPLVPLGEKPIMQVIIDDFVNLGVSKFYASVNYKSEMIEQFFDSIPERNYSIEYFKEDQPLGTAGSLSLLKDKISTTFFVSNCDILIDQDYSEVLKFHREKKNELTAMAALRHYKIPYGTMDIGEGGQLLRLSEKPELTFTVNAGVYILEPHLIDEIPAGEFFHITHLMEQIMARDGRVGVFPVSEKSWMDIGEWKEYDRTQELFKRWDR